MIDSIRLQNYRSYKDSSFEFDKETNIVVGPNASGKTNLLEAVLVLAGSRSFRASDSELVKISKPWARLDGHFGSQARTVKLVRAEDKIAKEYTIDNNAYKRLSLERTQPVVLFEPNHLQLASRGPQFRRDFFDDILERTQIGYKTLHNRYRRALSQRNALLKQPPARAKKQLFAWDIRLSELGAQVAAARYELAENTNKSLAKSYTRIAGKRSKARLEYQAKFDIKNYSSKLMSKLETSSDIDFERGFTVYGPHREDFALYLNGQPVQDAASRGEVRSLLIALKIFELVLVEKARAAKPIFLLDDVFSELDGARRHHLVDYLNNYQTIITTTDADAVLEHFSGDHNLIPL